MVVKILGKAWENKHTDGTVIKPNITTYADGENAIVYQGGSLSDLIAGNSALSGMTENDILLLADRQNDTIQNGNELKRINTKLQAGDVIIIKDKKPLTVEQKKNLVEAENNLTRLERKGERWKRYGITAGSGAAAGAAIGAFFGCPIGGAIIGFAVGSIAFFIARKRNENLEKARRDLSEMQEKYDID